MLYVCNWPDNAKAVAKFAATEKKRETDERLFHLLGHLETDAVARSGAAPPTRGPQPGVAVERAPPPPKPWSWTHVAILAGALVAAGLALACAIRVRRRRQK